MALGVHWEWRGFGAVSDSWRKRFAALPADETTTPSDNYLWVPGISVNLKLRRGMVGQNGLKLKRLRERRGELELWEENEADLFPFPLRATAWRTLAEELAVVGVDLPPYPDTPPGFDRTVAVLRSLTPRLRVVLVEKRRASAVWQGTTGAVAVELARITRPVTVVSVGLENQVEPGAPDDAGYENVLAAHRALQLADEPLRPMNYIDALTTWMTEGG